MDFKTNQSKLSFWKIFFFGKCSLCFASVCDLNFWVLCLLHDERFNRGEKINVHYKFYSLLYGGKKERSIFIRLALPKEFS